MCTRLIVLFSNTTKGSNIYAFLLFSDFIVSSNCIYCIPCFMFCFMLRHVRECDKLHAFVLYCFKFFLCYVHCYGITKAVIYSRVEREVFCSERFRFAYVWECGSVSVISFKECENICFETHLGFLRIGVRVYVYVYVCVCVFELVQTKTSTFLSFFKLFFFVLFFHFTVIGGEFSCFVILFVSFYYISFTFFILKFTSAFVKSCVFCMCEFVT